MQTKYVSAALIGPTNAGKSTLFNAIIGKLVSVVTHKVQTTRHPIRGIKTSENTQLVIVDTPGILRPQSPLEKQIQQGTRSIYREIWDYMILVMDASKGITKTIRDCLTINHQDQILLVLNKVDRMQKSQLLSLTEEMMKFTDFDAVFMVSALKNDGVSDIIKYLEKNAAVCPWHYPEDIRTDAPVEFIAAEITRKHLFINIHEEIPYNLVVYTERSIEQKKNNSIIFFQVVCVKRESHKAIILGKKGGVIDRIRTHAEKEIGMLLSLTVKLVIFIKVSEQWSKDPNMVEYIGY